MQRKTFTNTRVRFQRLHDAKLFSGWVRSFGRAVLLVTLTREGNVQMGEEFIFQVFGPGSIAMFRGVLTLCVKSEVTFSVVGAVQLITSKEDMRVLVEGVTGTLLFHEREHEVMFVDVSDKGAGIIAPQEIPKGSQVELRIDSSQGQVVCTGEVRYCKKMPNVPGQYRIGMQLVPQNRIDTARWQRLLQAEAA